MFDFVYSIDFSVPAARCDANAALQYMDFHELRLKPRGITLGT